MSLFIHYIVSIIAKKSFYSIFKIQKEKVYLLKEKLQVRLHRYINDIGPKNLFSVGQSIKKNSDCVWHELYSRHIGCVYTARLNAQIISFDHI